MVQGQITPASAQAGTPLQPIVLGLTSQKAPSGDWPSSTSTSHLVKKAATSALQVAVRMKTWASPIQPSRSSRCGQSVGMLR